ncbi:dephospho-CoA kinase [Streptomonospora nanhaiensis]|uniref:Dephospho-CoA kinase n=1 Tax=Streptomonospora nanhaiensis TaxID=1323731 RepID=A0A853BIB0_9ACTN|nr:dephospho-CoA kinase [Streptomonospora nanhaiensis]MBV2365233.1 dephospho-CoA kinase, long form [Streptomonospora nanhaiensis]NYI94760.1 dephospho-CoA kinase [Streptomonospora nanhaiensis]
MLRVGLTGGIGSGKSAVARRLAEHGAVVVDADQIAREVVEPGTPGLAEVVAEFGEEVLTPEGRLDRPRLGEIVFSDSARLARLNAIVHPRVAARTEELMAAAPVDAVVVYDVPLLVENDLGALYDVVVVVDLPEEEQVARVVANRGMPADQVRARIKAQATRERRRAAADVVIDNSGTPADLDRRVAELWADLSARA